MYPTQSPELTSKPDAQSAEELDRLGLACSARREWLEARSYHLRALARHEREASGSIAMIRCLNHLGNVSWELGAFDESRRYHERALAIQERKAPRSVEMADSLAGLARLHLHEQNLAAARSHYEKALNIRATRLPESRATAQLLAALGHLTALVRDYPTSRSYYERALAIQERLDPESAACVESLTMLGNLAREAGQLAAARDYYTRALSLQRKLAPGTLTEAATLRGLAEILRAQRDLQTARQMAREALLLTEKQAPDSLELAASFSCLGNVAADSCDYATARDCYERSLAIVRRRDGDPLHLAGCLDVLGHLARERGDLKAARELQREALKIREERIPGSADHARSLLAFAALAEAERDVRCARKYYERALEIQQALEPGSMEVAKVHHALGSAAFRLQDLARAEKWAASAWELARRHGGGLVGDEARQTFMADARNFATDLVQYRLRLGRYREAFTTAEEGRAQALEQLLWDRRLEDAVADPQLWKSYREAVTARDRAGQGLADAELRRAQAEGVLRRLSETHALSAKIDRGKATLETSRRRSEQARATYLEARFRADAALAAVRSSAPGLFPPTRDLEAMRQALAPDTLHLSFVVGQSGTVLFVVRRQGSQTEPVEAYHCPVGEVELRRLIRDFVDAVSQRRLDCVQSGRTLFTRIFPPEAWAIVRKVRRLLISPDGPMWEIPFAALVTNAQGAPEYLGASHALCFTPSLSLFAQASQQSRKPREGRTVQALVVGDPIFARSAEGASPSRFILQGDDRSVVTADGKAPPRLPNTGLEAAAVAQLYGCRPLIGEKATEKRVRTAMPQADLIHLATHGYLHPVRAMSSGLLLTVPAQKAAPPDTSRDGVLLAWEIHSQMRLRADLVVLSACETGRGENVRGEGLVGLTRALQVAGARSIIASQWKVQDRCTARFMLALHRSLRSGAAKDEALKRAMGAMRSDPTTAHPFNWAAFYLLGDPENSLPSR